MFDAFVFLGDNWLIYVITFAVVMLAAVAQSSLGLGFGVVAAPVMALLDPRMVPGPLLVLAMVTSLIVLIRDRSELRFGHLSYALLGRLLASVLGALTASLLDQGDFMLLFGSLILCAVGLSLIGWRIKPSRTNLFLAGSASGYMGTITSVGAPPMAIVYQHSSPGEVRANMSAFLAAGALVSIGSLAGFGVFDTTQLVFAVTLAPALVAGLWLSRFAAPYVNRGWMRPAILALCVMAAATLLIRSATL